MNGIRVSVLNQEITHVVPLNRFQTWEIEIQLSVLNEILLK
jgi:hypothetical protein